MGAVGWKGRRGTVAEREVPFFPKWSILIGRPQNEKGKRVLLGYLAENQGPQGTPLASQKGVKVTGQGFGVSEN